MSKLFGRSWLLKLSVPLVGACIGVVPFIVNADDETSAYPKRTVTIVVPVAPGGPNSYKHSQSTRIQDRELGLKHAIPTKIGHNSPQITPI